MTEVVTVEQLPAALARLAAPPTAEQLRPLREDLARYLLDVSRGALEAARSPAGAPFAPLARSTRRRKRGGRPLIRTGALAASYFARPAGAWGLDWGNEVTYFRFHQTGTRRLPARPTVEAAPNVLAEIDRRTADFAAQLIATRPL